MGCGNDAPAPQENTPAQTEATPAQPSPEPSAPANTSSEQAASSTVPKPVTIKPLTLGALGGGKSNPEIASTNAGAGKDTLNSVLDAMQPLQVFLGQWNTTTRSMGAGTAHWVWDFKTDKSQPALVMSTKDHPYFDSVRLTFLSDKQKFQLTAKDKDRQARIYEGVFTEKPHQVTGDTGKPEPRFEMMLDEVGN
jgi:hypothetical protein